MKIAVLSNDNSFTTLMHCSPIVQWERVNNLDELLNAKEVNALMNMEENAGNEDYSGTILPVFINSVCQTLAEKKHANNIIRINGWNGFLARSTWELSGHLSQTHSQILTLLEKKYVPVPDEPGFIAARIIAMIVNEAYFALEDKVSTKDEIDIAMKLGTNYPKGPFEWANEIGIAQIDLLLQKLSISDKRYIPCNLLSQENATA
jgi:3-hydroxybutyryl-CoA dehydrogenase